MLNQLKLHLLLIIHWGAFFAITHNGIAQNWEPFYFSEAAMFSDAESDPLFYLYLYPYSNTAESTTGRFLPHLIGDVPCGNSPMGECSGISVCKVASLVFPGEFAVYIQDGVLELRNPDTLRIHYMAEQGDTWIFNTAEPNSPVIAEVTEKYYGSVLGEPDSIKVVTTTGGTTFHLSKHYGIILWSDLEHLYSLESIPGRNMGASALSRESVFDYSPGDVFVYLSEHENTINEGTSQDMHAIGKSVRRVDVLTVENNPDGLVVELEITMHNSYSVSYPIGGFYTSGVGSVTFNVSMEIPFDTECAFYQWPIGGPAASQFDIIYDPVVSNIYSELFTSDWGADCTAGQSEACANENLLLGYSGSTENRYQVITSGVYGTQEYIGLSAEIENSLLTQPPSSIADALSLNPQDFNSMYNLRRCGYTNQPIPPHIEQGEQFLIDHNPGSSNYYGNWFILGKALGIVAFKSHYFGLGFGCSAHTVMIGYQKADQEPLGLLPTAQELMSLSTNNTYSTGALLLYPNPASTAITLHLSGHTLTHATLLDMQGREVLSVALSPGEPVVNVSHLPKGMYLMRATEGGGGVFIKKLIIQ